MTLAYFDCFSGISGDMALGALLDCGVPLEALREGLASLPVEGWHIEARPVLQSGIHALDVEISLHGETDAQELERVQAAHSHAHDHHHHNHAHAHHDHEHHHEHHHHGRSMREIREIIEASELSARVKHDALKVFEKIAEAEAHLHHSTPDEVHFHEIGGVDSLLDICGVAWCLEYLGVERVVFSPLPMGSGFVQCAHGIMPVPAPATLRLLQGAPTVPSDVKGELVTPTGAGFVAALGSGFGQPIMTPQKIGHGSGKKRFAEHPNFLRVVIGTENAASTQDGLEWRTLTLLESNVDDMNPESWGHVIESVMQNGALDAWLEPVQMKKGRPAFKMCALCKPDQRDAMLRVMLRETTTLGVRVQEVQRAALPRTVVTIATPLGEARVKVARWPQGDVSRVTPEWEDVARLARERNLPSHEAYALVLDAARQTMQTASNPTCQEQL